MNQQKNFRNIFFTITFLIISSCNSISGYQNLYFGEDLSTILKKNFCNLKKENQSIPFVIPFSCNNFTFMGEKHTGKVLFINNKLHRIIIKLIPEEVEKVILTLDYKYGKGTIQSSHQLFIDYRSQKPNIIAYSTYLNNQLQLILQTNSAGKQIPTLHFVSNKYRNLQEKAFYKILEQELSN